MKKNLVIKWDRTEKLNDKRGVNCRWRKIKNYADEGKRKRKRWQRHVNEHVKEEDEDGMLIYNVWSKACQKGKREKG